MRDYKRGDYPLIVDPKFYFGDNQIVRGSTGRDLMRINDAFNTVYAGAGNDLITIVGANNALIYGEAGDDFIGVISKVEKNPTIYGGKGNDTIRTLSDKTYADGGEDNDLFIPLDSVSRTTLVGGAGNDTFWFIESSTVTATGGDGNDVYRFDPYYLFGPYHNDVVITDISSNDTIRYDFSESSGDELSYREENGNIILEDDFGFFNITLKGGASKKSEIAKVKYQSIDWSGTLGELFSELTVSSIEGGNNDMAETLISNLTNSIVITGTSYADSITNLANYVTINSGAGNDSIITGRAGNIVNAGAGNDYVDTYKGTTNIKISGGDGNDTIKLGSNGATVNGDAGDDYLYVYTSGINQTVFGGAGKDSAFSGGENVLIETGAGNDYVQLYNSAKKNTITGGDGNDTIKIGGDSVIANGGTGDDYFYVYNNGYNQTVIGGEGKDSAFSGGENVLIETGEGNDYIHLYNSAKNHTVSGGTGDDVIKSYSSLGTLFRYSSGDGNDSINGISANDTLRIENTTFSTVKSGSTLIITAGSGKITVDNGANVAFKIDGDTDDDDVISNSANNTVITGTSSADNISNSGNYVTINGANGNDTITNYPGNYVSISGGAGDDKISNLHGYLDTVDGGAGNDYIYNTGESAKIYAGDGNDTIVNEGIDDVDGYGTRNSGENVTISGGKGDDSICGCGSKEIFLYEAGDGNDTILGIGSQDTIKISGTTYSTAKSGSDMIITAGSGKISVQGGANVAFTILGDKPEPVIFNPTKTSATITADFNEGTFDAADYPKLVKVDATEATVDLEILGNAKNNKIDGSENNDTLYGGKGTDTLTGNGGADTFRIVKGEGNKVIADYTEGEDIIYVEGIDVETVRSKASVKSGSVIFTVGTNKITVKGGDGQQILLVDEDGNEYIYPTMNGGLEFNPASTSVTVTAYYEDSTFDAADYPKLLTIDATEATVDLEILGNDKNNKIYGSENNDTLYGGRGTDTLTGNGGADTFRIVKGEGNKVIADYTEGEDVIYVEGIDVETVIDKASVKSGNVIFTVGTNKVTVKGGDGQQILLMDEDGNEYTYPKPNDDVKFNAAKTAATITADFAEDTFDAANYDAPNLATINASEAALDLTIIGNENANSIIGSENSDCISGGKGDDTLTGGSGEDIFVYNDGDGNDVITDYTEGEDRIEIYGADVEDVVKSATTSNGDVIFKVGSGKITVKEGDGQQILLVDEDGNEYTYPNDPIKFNPASTSATITAYYEEDTFDAADYPKLVTIDATEATVDLEILGNAKNNKIYGSENNDTLYGGKGTDTLTGNGGADTFRIVKGEGNKVIADYTEGEDIIYVEGADVETVINSASIKSGSVIFKVGTNNVTVKGGDGQQILLMDEDGNEYTYPSEPDEEKVIFNAASTSATVTAYYEDSTFDAADYPKLVTIDATEAAIDLEILGNAKNNKIYGSENNDTLYGGKGTDTLTGNGGADTFHIVKGEGNKVIADYAEGEDVIYVEGADVETVINSASIKSGSVVFKVGTNNVTVKGGSGQEILFADEDGNESTYGGSKSGRSALWFTEDDTNFISDAPQLDFISEPKYSVAEMQTTNLEIFAQDKQDLPVITSDK